MKLYDELVWRGLIENITDESLIEKINNGGLTFYIGTDPTGDSLHIGHYSTFSMATRLKKGGHNPILLVGGATGLIGDPKPTAERPMITKEQLDYNYKKLRQQVENIFGFEVVNNYDWSKDINFIDYLRDYGKYFNLNYMLNKETVKSRLDVGITYTEFSYMIMQSLDFLWLYENKGCTLQIGGSDQWGNITSGVELIRKKIGKEAYGLTMPLITKADGTKFGKSEGNAIWLDINKTSSYEMYQFFLNAEDSKVIEYLKKLTFLSIDEINKLEKKHLDCPEKREAHKALAKEVITFLHGANEYEKAVKISEALFSGNIKNLTKEEILIGFKGVPTFKFEEKNLVDLLVDNNICSSKREAREFINNGAIVINDEKILEDKMITKDLAIDESILVLRKGKKKYYLGVK
ncbi:MAG TPA: tyrosine--tRNA ligase [Candidatus Faecisoma merdavium]|nr:tyrosine--tRNA ligase [Candidatus Faecisoma merdavium]